MYRHLLYRYFNGIKIVTVYITYTDWDWKYIHSEENILSLKEYEDYPDDPDLIPW